MLLIKADEISVSNGDIKLKLAGKPKTFVKSSLFIKEQAIDANVK
jgi:hypothetical protein